MAILSAILCGCCDCGRKKLRGLFIAALALFFCGGMDLSAQAEISKEYQVKAAFLFNFTHFVDWPTNAFSDAQSPLTIGILGDDPFDNFLDATVRGENVNGHPLIIQRFRRVEDATNCQVLFISRSEGKKMAGILAQLNGRDILTVSDADDFSEKGGDIGFVTTEQNKIHFHINVNAAKNAGLTISSKLLRLADIVETEKKSGS